MVLRMMRLAAVVLVLAGAAPAASAAEPRLAAGQWNILELGGKRIRGTATMNFTRLRWLGIKTPCGPLWGWYSQSGPTLKIHIPGSTRYVVGDGSPCHGLDYRSLLGRVRSYQADGDGLTFANEEGKVIARLARAK